MTIFLIGFSNGVTRSFSATRAFAHCVGRTHLDATTETKVPVSEIDA
jgi:hypothetical protein